VLDVLGRSVGVEAVEHAGGLSNLDKVDVGVAQTAPYLGLAVKWLGKELCPFGFSVGVERRYVGNPHVKNDEIGSPGSGGARMTSGLSGFGPQPGFMMIQLLATLTMAGFSSNTTRPPKMSA
jgi:hypothetical protein